MAIIVISTADAIRDLIVGLVTSDDNAVNISGNLRFKHVVVKILFCNDATHFPNIGIIFYGISRLLF